MNFIVQSQSNEGIDSRRFSNMKLKQILADKIKRHRTPDRCNSQLYSTTFLVIFEFYFLEIVEKKIL